MFISVSACGEANMNSGPIIMLIICAGLLVYLVYAMLRPEKF
jgi:K+-transporting ATPase KdpF subunit